MLAGSTRPRTESVRAGPVGLPLWHVWTAEKPVGEKPANSVRIALSHYPDTILCTEFLKPDLYLCGHTHGGQICLPGRIPILRHDKLPRRLCSGVHRFHDTWMITSRGFGFSSMVPLRVFCPAEVGEITLVRGGVP